VGIAMPGDSERWRCTGCGNLTRFDVTRTVRSQDFVHQELSGVGAVEERTVLSETVERVKCRWCGATDSVEIVPRPDADSSVSDASAESPTGRA
jgi:ribosomal protein S27E